VIELSISVEGEFGLTWPRRQRLVRTVEGLGFAGLYLADHFLLTEEVSDPSLEMIVALTWLADHTERVRFGPMVAPLSIRDPVMLARQAAALDDLSGGRMVLGLGAGWMESEHAMFGYPLGDVPRRMARFAEGVQIIAALLRSSEPVTFSGEFFHLRDAVLPGPRRPGGPPLMIGGSGPKRTLPLVARYADVWNGQEVKPDEFRQRGALLDDLLRETGREPQDVRRTMNTWVICGRTDAELEERVRPFRLIPGLDDLPLTALLDELRTWFAIIGTPQEVAAQIRAYAAAGVSEVSVQWPGLEDMEGLRILAEEVKPLLQEPAP
jgi:alkanesulfonate monooxygenase SsuD/methylene tetrahydromethanopterin reductase-like flavin-dependent oxidoreductase (luciferase family)